MAEVFALEIDLRSAQARGKVRSMVERRGTPDEFARTMLQLALERGIAPRLLVGLLQLSQRRHQRLGDILAAELAEVAVAIGQTWHCE